MESPSPLQISQQIIQKPREVKDLIEKMTVRNSPPLPDSPNPWFLTMTEKKKLVKVVRTERNYTIPHIRSNFETEEAFVDAIVRYIVITEWEELQISKNNNKGKRDVAL